MDRARFVHGFRHQPLSGEAAESLAVPLRGRGETAETTPTLGVHSVAVRLASARAVLWNNEFRADFKNHIKGAARQPRRPRGCSAGAVPSVVQA